MIDRVKITTSGPWRWWGNEQYKFVKKDWYWTIQIQFSRWSQSLSKFLSDLPVHQSHVSSKYSLKLSKIVGWITKARHVMTICRKTSKSNTFRWNGAETLLTQMIWFSEKYENVKPPLFCIFSPELIFLKKLILWGKIFLSDRKCQSIPISLKIFQIIQ